MTGSWRRLLVPLLGSVLFAAPLAAQTSGGIVTGRVTEAGGRPVSDAQVIVVSTNRFASTNAEGRYTLRDVPEGPQNIRVLRVGFQESRRPVTVVGGQTLTVDFQLTEAVVQLSEIVTTATGQQRRVEIGNVIGSVGDVAKRVEQTPITNATDLLVAKVPGVVVLPGNMTGSAPQVRIRGLNSLAVAGSGISNAPIWVIDGVRMTSGSTNIGTGGTQTSFLNGLNPEEIENMEVVKGPSAATLYGTDAANGVIVITTRRGRAGKTRFTVFTEGGLVQDRNDYLTQYALWGHAPATPTTATRCNLQTVSAKTCIADSLTSYNIFETPDVTPLTTGDRRSGGLQISGGTEQVRYFLSGDLERELGPVRMPDFSRQRLQNIGVELRDEWDRPERFDRQNFRANLQVAANRKLDINVSSGYVQTRQRLPQVDNNSFSYLYNAYNNPGYRGKGQLGYTGIGLLGEELMGYGLFAPSEIFQVFSGENTRRFIGSVDGNWRPFSWMTNTGLVGVDFADRVINTLCRFGECPNSGTTRQGSAFSSHTNFRNFSARLASSMVYNFRPSLNFRTTVGTDYFNEQSDFTSASSTQLPPGAQNVGQGAVRTGSSSLAAAVKTLGLFIEEQATIRDRLFLTAAVRSDQNSAFGTNFQNVFYPKASISYLISDEDFFPTLPAVSSLRLRAAYGSSGVQPGSAVALQQFSSQTVTTLNASNQVADVPGLVATALGNPDLKPEVSGEFEGGLDIGLFSNERVRVELTYYSKLTRDALIAQPIAPSSGAPSTGVGTGGGVTPSVLRNLGSVKNAGVEVGVNATVLDIPALRWTLGFNGSHNTNKVVSLGKDAQGNPNPTIGTGALRHEVGKPANGWFFRPYTFADTSRDGFITADEVTVGTEFQYFGYSTPRDLASITSEFGLLDNRLRINLFGDYKGGFSLLNQTVQFYCANTNTCEEHQKLDTPLWRQARQVAQRYKNPNTQLGYLENGQFWRLREVSVTYLLPEQLAARYMGGESATLTLGARNLKVWTKYTGVDPEANYSTGDVQTDFSTTAPRTYFTARLTLNF